MKRLTTATVLALGAALGVAPASAVRPCDPFEELRLTLEQNATDGDAEVVLFAQGGDEGLRELRIAAPGGQRSVKIEASKRGIGIREFLLESAEPPDLPAVLASFPEGTYTFKGRTVSGGCLVGMANLSHELAPATTLLSPEPSEVVPAGDLTLEWAAVPEAALYIVELQNEDLGNEHRFEVLPPSTSLVVPAALIEADAEYQFGVAVETAGGNVTAVELTFQTAP